MRISKDSLKGYILEEALAYLIRKTGYKLIVDKEQDPIELRNRGNGLVVVGRGGEHQADVLGQLLWIPTFTYPIRLFVEAKFRNSKVGIDIVRNAVGIIDDLNQNYSPMTESRILVKRYSYNFAIFSTSGFTKNAVDMAIAHKISLIDLSGDEFSLLRNSIDRTATEITREFNFSDEVAAGLEGSTEEFFSRGSFTRALRNYLRITLGTWPQEVPFRGRLTIEEENFLAQILSNLVDTIKTYGELFVGMANGPFLLILKSSNPEKFREYAKYYPTHQVRISWGHENSSDNQWFISPYDYKDESAYELTFTLPKVLGDLVFKNNNPTQKALYVKGEYLSSITIYTHDNKQDKIFRLEYVNERPII